VEVALDTDITLVHGMIVTMGLDAVSEIRQSPPYSFTLRVPSQDSDSGHLIGFHKLNAVGAVAGRKDDPFLAAVDVDVEEPDLPLEISAFSNAGPQKADPSMRFFSAGTDESVEVYAKFPGGRVRNVTESTHLTALSENPRVARVFGYGGVSSTGPGDTVVVFTYSLGSEHKQIFVPAHVAADHGNLVADPAVVDFGDQPVGTTSTRAVTLTNKATWPIEVGTLTGGFRREAENCSHTTLPPGGQCSITFTFSPATPGPDHDILYISNTSGQIQISFFGNGI
jgi:hypothetical protein